MKRIAFATLGCKANFVDTEEMTAACRRSGLALVSFDDEADACVINTCTVTAVADQQSRQLIRRARRENPNAFVIAVGCLGAVDRESVAAIGGVDAVFGTADRGAALAFLFERLGVSTTPHPLPSPLPARRSFSGGRGEGRQSRARAFVKIQDGCDRSCAYCIVPQARGGSRSVPPEQIEDRCRALARFHREIVLTGIDIGQYGRDLERSGGRGEGTTLLTLLARLATDPRMPRLRISSIDPTVVDEGLIELIASGRLCRHVHLSIQSGADAVLARMGRRYTARDIEGAVARLARRIPDVAVTGDVIAGLPGETDVDHRRTAELLASLPLAGLHVFPYSARRQTPAAGMSDQVPPAIRRGRAAELRQIAVAKRRRFLERMIGRPLEVIVTSRAPDPAGRVKGFSDNAISISMPAGGAGYGERGPACITEVMHLTARGIWDSARMTKSA